MAWPRFQVDSENDFGHQREMVPQVSDRLLRRSASTRGTCSRYMTQELGQRRKFGGARKADTVRLKTQQPSRKIYFSTYFFQQQTNYLPAKNNGII